MFTDTSISLFRTRFDRKHFLFSQRTIAQQVNEQLK